MPRQEGFSLKAKVGMTLVGIGLPLVWIMSYNMGFVSSEDRNAVVVENYNAINQVVRRQLSNCQKRQREKKDDNSMGALDVTEHQEYEVYLSQENALLHTTNEELREQIEKCDGKFDRLMTDRYDNNKQTPAQKVVDLQLEKDELLDQLAALNKTKKEARASLKERVRALRLENQQIKATLDELQAQYDKEEKEFWLMEEEQRKMPDKDYGFGEDSDESWFQDFSDTDKQAFKDLNDYYKPPKSASADEDEFWRKFEEKAEEGAQMDPDYLWDQLLVPTPAPTSAGGTAKALRGSI